MCESVFLFVYEYGTFENCSYEGEMESQYIYGIYKGLEQHPDFCRMTVYFPQTRLQNCRKKGRSVGGKISAPLNTLIRVFSEKLGCSVG